MLSYIISVARARAALWLATLLLCLTSLTQAAPPEPGLRATWILPGHARVTWSGPGCLYRLPASGSAHLLACSDDQGAALELPAPGRANGWTWFPEAGDQYELVRDGATVARTELRWVLHLPALQYSPSAGVRPAEGLLPC